jgi:hypothetical protein
VQVVPEANVPWPLEDSETVPAGELGLDEVSDTVTVQLTGASSVAGDGAQATAVAVLSVTVSVAGGLALAASVAPGPKDAVRCWAPDALGL